MPEILLSPVCACGARGAGHVLHLIAPLWTPRRRGGLEALPWLNSNTDRRLHHQTRRKISAEWRAAGHALGLAALEAGLPRMERAEIWAYVWRRDHWALRPYDPANWYPTAKPVVDGFVDAGVLPADDRFHVRGPFMDHGGILPPDPAAGVGEIAFHLIPLEVTPLWPHAP